MLLRLTTVIGGAKGAPALDAHAGGVRYVQARKNAGKIRVRRYQPDAVHA